MMFEITTELVSPPPEGNAVSIFTWEAGTWPEANVAGFKMEEIRNRAMPLIEVKPFRYLATSVVASFIRTTMPTRSRTAHHAIVGFFATTRRTVPRTHKEVVAEHSLDMITRDKSRWISDPPNFWACANCGAFR